MKRMLRVAVAAVLSVLTLASGARAQDPSWPRELTLAILSTESAPEIVRRWGPILAQLEKDLRVKHVNVDAIAQIQLQSGSLGYRSCLIAHADSDIFTPEDLGGRSFAFNDPNSTSGYLVPSAFFLMEMGVDPRKHAGKLTFSGSHEASILAVANKKVEAASTNLSDMQQLVREGKVARGALRVIWVSKLIPNDPLVVRKDLPASLRQDIQESLVTMKARAPEAFKDGGAFFGAFVRADDSKYQVIRDLDETAKRLAGQK